MAKSIDALIKGSIRCIHLEVYCEIVIETLARHWVLNVLSNSKASKNYIMFRSGKRQNICYKLSKQKI